MVGESLAGVLVATPKVCSSGDQLTVGGYKFTICRIGGSYSLPPAGMPFMGIVIVFIGSIISE